MKTTHLFGRHLAKAALLAFVFLLSQNAWAQLANQFWRPVDDGDVQLTCDAQRHAPLPDHYVEWVCDVDALRTALRAAPMEFTDAAPVVVWLPVGEGQLEPFEVFESPVLEPALQARFPMIRTWAGRSALDPATTMRMAWGTRGLHAIVQRPGGTVLIEPWADHGGGERYISYTLAEAGLDGRPPCELPADETGVDPSLDWLQRHTIARGLQPRGPENLHIYRLAVATTGEFSDAHGGAGGSVANVLSAVTYIVNQVNSVMERDLGIRLMLIDETTKVFFFDGATDPYTNGSTGDMIQENPPVLADSIGNDKFDIGHVFGTNAGGLAGVAVVCRNGKARGVSCTFGAYSGDKFYIIVAHEMGHQLNGLHTFNKCDGENESPSTAYEPGSGSTIMCYAGASNCGSNYVQNIDDDYYHINSMERILYYTREDDGATCAQVMSTNNTSPEADIPIEGGFYIPIETPFELTGVGTDADGDALTYVWEEYDLGPPTDLGQAQFGTPPIFRSVPPSTSPTRTFPRYDYLVNNVNHPTEVLPTYTRALTFRFTVRDNHAGGGSYDFDEIAFQATEAAGPFRVTSPNAPDDAWTIGDYVEVTWDVANTTNSQVNCQHVNIRLSLDGGYTYPVTLLENTPNDGSAFVVVPNMPTDEARVRVEAADNIFFDISNHDFDIVLPDQPALFAAVEPVSAQVCLPDSFAFDLITAGLVGLDTLVEIQLEGAPAGAQVSFSQNPAWTGDTVHVTLDLSAVTTDGLHTLEVKAIVPGLDTVVRPLALNVVYSDFSDLALLEPASGTSGVEVLPTFAWTDLPQGDYYDIQIATSPAFDSASIVDEATAVTAATYVPSVTLDGSTIYYWRLRPGNECGYGAWTGVAAFATVTQSCTSYTSEDTPINISAAGLPTVVSEIGVSQTGVIDDVNVLNVKGTHDAVRHIEVRIVSPLDSAVVLMHKDCGNTQVFDVGFDDEAPNPLNCPPSDGQLYQPKEPLAKLDGQEIQGTWRLEVEVLDNFGNGGQLESWTVEFCGAIQPKSPYLVKNDTLRVPPGGVREVNSFTLVAEDEDTPHSELTYTVVTDVRHGTLYRDGQPLGVGGTFTQSDVDGGLVWYAHDGQGDEPDGFTFTITDGTGGWLPITPYHIVIDPDAPVGTREAPVAERLHFQPNPASGVLQIRFGEALARAQQGRLLFFDAMGRQVREERITFAGRQYEADVSALPSGLYLVVVRTDAGTAAGRVVVLR